MKQRITIIINILAGMFFASLSVAGQRLTNEPATQVRVDSCITYSMTGEYVYKYVTVLEGDLYSEKKYRWENMWWIEDESVPSLTIPFITYMGTASVETVGDQFRFYIPAMRGDSYWYWSSGVSYETEYDSRGNLTELNIGSKFIIRYAAESDRVTAIDHYDWNGVHVDSYRYEYHSPGSGLRTLFEHTTFDGTKGKWVAGHSGKMIRKYESYQLENGGTGFNLLTHEEYGADVSGNWVGEVKYDVKYDSNNKKSIIYHYVWYGAKWTQIQYTVFYPPNSIVPNAGIGHNNPVYDTNRGAFGIETVLRIDSVAVISLVVKFPAGFTIDPAYTKLAEGWEDFDLTITSREGNEWQLDIRRRETRRATLRSDAPSTLLADIAYTVDEAMKRGTYNITVHSILFETPGGESIVEPAITVPAVLNRWGVGNEAADVSQPSAWSHNGAVYIRSSHPQQVAVYSLSGAKVYEGSVQAGTTALPAARLPKGALIIRSSSGWTAKVVNRQ
jgi:hypothetical protein